MKKIWFGLLTICLCQQMVAQDLSGKKKQLEELNEEISKQEEFIQLTEEEQRRKQQDLLQTERQKAQTDKKVKNLLSSEKETKKKLDFTIKELKSTSSYLEDLVDLCQNELNSLVLAHYQSEIFPEKKLECRFLANMVEMTTQKIYEFDSKKHSLEKKKASENKQYEDVIWSRIVADKKRKEYAQTIVSIQSNIEELEQERAEALARKKELEENALALDQLIKRLQTEIIEQDFSYEFSTAKLVWPLQGSIIKPYGEQYNAQYKVSTINKGIDIAVPEGTAVMAVEGGEVAFAEWYNGAGKLIIIDHKNGYHTLYSHNSALLVSKGDKVFKNQEIALSGKTGSAKVPSLHFEIRRRGAPVDPMEYLE